MKAFTDFLQGSEEWFRIRVGRITASRLEDVLRKSPTAKTRIDYILELAQERRTGEPAEGHGTVFMKASQHLEPFARRLYEEMTGTQVDQYGFVVHPSMDFFGCSPDGVVDLAGGLEIKCPTLKRHLEWRRKGVVPTTHLPQMMGNIMCCESDWWDFMSYNPLADPKEQTFICRLDRNEKRIDHIDAAVRQLNDEVNELLANLPNAPLADQPAPHEREDRMNYDDWKTTPPEPYPDDEVDYPNDEDDDDDDDEDDVPDEDEEIPLEAYEP